jgi:protein TonB
MFDQTFVDGAGKTNKSWAVTLSFAAEFAAIGLMILVPLLWTEVLPRAQFVNSLTAPAPAPAPPPPPASMPVARQVRIAPRAFNHSLEAPRPQHEIPQVAIILEDPTPLPGNLADTVAGVPGAAQAGTAIIFSNGIDSRILQPSTPRSTARPDAQQEKPLLVGGKVQSAKLIKHPAPAYPAIAKNARIQGTVVLQAIIGKDGAVRNLAVVGAASPLLIPSAMEAVKQWLYQPTLLNEEPVEVITEISVIFALQ